jgi:hypothetical protein
MSEMDGLERRYARLLAWYPEPFRTEQGGEVLGVLMAAAEDGQRRPRLRERVDVLKSALGMRMRGMKQSRVWADALALFSFVAPLFTLAVYVLEVAFPDHEPVGLASDPTALTFVPGFPSSLLSQPVFRVLLISQLIIAVLVLAGLRWVALAALVAGTAACGIVINSSFLPYQLKVIAPSFAILEVAALIASPGPRRGRHLVNWGHGVVLLFLAAAIQVSTLAYDKTNHFAWPPPRSLSWGLVAISVVLALAALAVATARKLGWHLPLLLGGMLYAYALLLATTPPASSGSDLIGSPTLVHLALLFLPALLLAGYFIVTAALAKRHRSPGPELA